MKSSLTPETAKKIAEDAFNKMQNKEDAEFFIKHSEAVGRCALLIAKNRKVEKKILMIAGWVHDIGYLVSKENHAQHSLEMLEKEFEINNTLKDCILNHGSTGKPETEEGRIIQVADKACMINLDIVKMLVEYSLKKNEFDKDKDFGFIKKMLKQGIDFLREFK